MATQIVINPHGDEIVLSGVQNGTEVYFYASSGRTGSALNRFNKIDAYFVFGEGQTKHVRLTFTAGDSQTIDIKDIAPPLFTKVGIFVSLEDDITTDGDLYEHLTTNTLVLTFDGKTLADYGITDAYTKTEVNNLLDGKADKATSLAGYGIDDAYTKTEIDTMIGDIESLLQQV